MLKRPTAGIVPLALWSVAAMALLLFAATGSGLGVVQRRVLLSRPLATGDLTGVVLDHLVTGRVVGASASLLSANSTAFKRANERCRRPAAEAPPLPKLRRAATWEGSRPKAAGNATAILAMPMDRLALLQAHCAVWPHTIQVAVYAPVCTSQRYVCLDEVASPAQLHAGTSWLGMLGLGLGHCQYSGWSLARLRSRVRDAQKQAQATGVCNLRVELWTEEVTEQLGPGAGMVPVASLQNRALQALQLQQDEAKAFEPEHAVVLLDSDIAAVDVWQLLNSTARWDRAILEMGKGSALVLPAFQLAPPPSVHEGSNGGAAVLLGTALESAVKAAMAIVTADAGKFPLRQKFLDAKARLYSDHGFSTSQDAALPVLWFEAGAFSKPRKKSDLSGDMHGDDDNGYPVVPQPGFAPFTVMLQQHVPWADERLRGSYYQRAWQSLAARSMGLRHVVQPNTFTLQLPHTHAYSMAEASLTNFLSMEPVFRQLVEELGAGVYVPVTTFGDACSLNMPAAEVY